MITFQPSPIPSGRLMLLPSDREIIVVGNACPEASLSTIIASFPKKPRNIGPASILPMNGYLSNQEFTIANKPSVYNSFLVVRS